jgi:hypothetical protein
VPYCFLPVDLTAFRKLPKTAIDAEAKKLLERRLEAFSGKRGVLATFECSYSSPATGERQLGEGSLCSLGTRVKMVGRDEVCLSNDDRKIRYYQKDRMHLKIIETSGQGENFRPWFLLYHPAGAFMMPIPVDDLRRAHEIGKPVDEGAQWRIPIRPADWKSRPKGSVDVSGYDSGDIWLDKEACKIKKIEMRNKSESHAWSVRECRESEEVTPSLFKPWTPPADWAVVTIADPRSRPAPNK